MPYPDWVEGKSQFSRLEQMTNAVNLTSFGLQSIKVFNGSGEVIAGNFSVWSYPDIYNDQDYLQLIIDGVLVQQLNWQQSLYLYTGNWKQPISPGYGDGGDMGIMYISKPITFFSSIEFKYYKTASGTIRVSLDVSLGIY